MSADIVNNCLQIVGRFLQLPQFLVDAGLVMKGDEDHRAIDGLAAARSILQYLFVLAEVEQCLTILFVEQTGYTVRVKLIDTRHELLCIGAHNTIIIGEFQQLHIR